MRYSEVVKAYAEIEHTTSRQRIGDLLAALIARTPPEVLGRLVYLTQGKLYPDFVGVEMGLAERLALRAVARALDASEEQVRKNLAATGDLGATAEQVLRRKGHRARRPLSVGEVYERLDRLARSAGPGAQGQKIELLRELVGDASPEEARYLVRTATGKLRLGVADMTLLDVLAMVYAGGKQARPVIERAYNLTSDLGLVATELAEGGLERLAALKPQPGRPIRPMLAQRLGSPSEIMQRMGGACAAEYKYDGERVQVHRLADGQVAIFSRRIEDITHQYPDVLESVRKHLRPRSAIFEGEVVAVEPGTGELRPFQELMHRKRKHRVQEAIEAYPVALVAFDLLYADSVDYTPHPYPKRRAVLSKAIESTPSLCLATQEVVRSAETLERFFLKAVADGAEGVVCKNVSEHATYRAGAREWLWIKYKREYVSAMADTVDLVVVGALHGRGRRGGTFGSLLLAAYDPEADVFRAVTKCGSGFSDQDLQQDLPRRLEPLELPHRHPRVDSRLVPDVWFVPEVVIEVIGAEITLSPTHTAALGQFRPGSGLAIRFPRFTGRYRDDKRPEDATTVAELAEMYRRQLRQLPQ
ncbi:MAG: ATP-dependent DNA ligase [Chloroflexi bacterium]|nr:ATP-dependent DNA ligase [Chloroflexota bacterium]